MSIVSRDKPDLGPNMTDRQALLDSPRPRSLPILPPKERTRSQARGHHEPLAEETREVDTACRPIYAVWELTLACDLACRHCGSRAGGARPDELDTAEACELVREMAELGVREVALIGGEVYLHDGWLDVVREIRRNQMQCTVVTGGRGITPERAREAKEAGVQSMAVSIDGDEATHDRLRGLSGSYEAARSALVNARRAGMQVAVNTQINRLSMPDLPHIFDVLVESGAHGWQLQLTVPVGRAADEPDIILQPYDLLELFPMLASLKERCNEARIKLMPGNNIGYYGPFEHILRNFTTEKHAESCSAGRSTLGIESNGDIKGCPSLPTESWVGGNIRKYKLRDIWERSSALRHMRDRGPEERWGYCKTCYYGSVCRGGCTWMATALFGKPGNNPYCHHRALEMHRVGKRERVTRIQEAEGLPFDRGAWALDVEDAR
ncbi:MAG: radical SAM protein [Polyangiaceae bacterium]|nr:radical SAM protein [Polyangiaceae bacterium]